MGDPGADVVLVVDDNVANREFLCAILRKRGYEVRSAHGGRQAIDMAVVDPPHLILLDIGMPDLNGYETCERLKSDPRTFEIPVIFLSALDDADDKVRAFHEGGVDYIVKPFDRAELMARIENQLKVVRLQRQMATRNAEVLRKNEQILRKNEEILAKNRALVRMSEDLESAHSAVGTVFSSLSNALIGKVLDDKYQLLELVGTGGHGAVYRAVHLVLERPLAVKVIRPSSVALPGELDRLRKESVSACTVHHPNAVEVYDAGVTREGLAYLVMELLVGRSLRSELDERGTLSLERCAEVVPPICDVLSAAHAGNVVHRDIKPDNIFLHRAPEGEVVKVVDFGIAKLLDPGGAPGRAPAATTEVIGTPEYVAPERFEATAYDGRADVYSLGVMVYEMLCGRVPFQASREFPWAVASMHMDDAPPSPQEINPAIPAEVEAVVLRALAKDPALRPSARDFGESFLAAIDASRGVAPRA